jgi:hypothetical protein
VKSEGNCVESSIEESQWIDLRRLKSLCFVLGVVEGLEAGKVDSPLLSLASIS